MGVCAHAWCVCVCVRMRREVVFGMKSGVFLGFFLEAPCGFSYDTNETSVTALTNKTPLTPKQ